MPYIKDKYVTLCNSCNKPITGESLAVNARVGHQKTWLYHISAIDCAYAEEVPLSMAGGEAWIGKKSRLR